ncbi:hypothetical protein PshuTeo2_44450 [Pseudomonas hunanensis]|nr:hypothetical protein [Pseudomonas hunanensis]
MQWPPTSGTACSRTATRSSPASTWWSCSSATTTASPLDDARSVIIYDSYIKLLDPARSYFTAADIAEFDKWKTQFDDFLKSGNLDPGFTIYKRYLDRVKQRLDFALAELNKGVDKMDFTTKETLLIDRKDAPWMKNQAELDDLWRKRVKDEVLRQKIAGNKNPSRSRKP